MSFLSTKFQTLGYRLELIEECKRLKKAGKYIPKDYDIILIDEIQFYPDAHIFCDKWANEGKIIEASGLNGDYRRKPFEQISLLIPLCDNIKHLVAVDKKDGNDAPFTCRLSDDNQQTLIGGNDIYQAMNRNNYTIHTNLKKINQQHLCI